MANDDIYESLLKYNDGRIDCLSQIKKKSKKYDGKSLSLSNLRNYGLLITKGQYRFPKELLDEYIRNPVPGEMDVSKILAESTGNPEVIDGLIEQAENRDYRDY